MKARERRYEADFGEFVDRSLMLATALSPATGCPKAMVGEGVAGA